MMRPMRGILSAAGYLPHWRLDRAAIAAFHGGRGSGTRAVASYDEDTTTMAVEAGRLALGATGVTPTSVWFSTPSPTYLDKTNATILHAALRLPSTALAFDAGGALRSPVAVLRAALEGSGPAMVVSSDIRVGLPNSPDESAGGDAAAALIVGETEDRDQLAAEYLGGASVTGEFLDRWRSPGEWRSRQWEEKFGENHYVDLVTAAWADALATAGVGADDIDEVIVATLHARAGAVAGKRLGRPMADNLTTVVGAPGAAQAGLLVADAIERLPAGVTFALVSLADGADVLVFRTTGGGGRAARTVAEQVASGDPTLPYAKYLAWRGIMTPNPPNRPEPARMSATAAGRTAEWKYGFVGSRDRSSGAVHLPPARVSFEGGAVDDMEPAPMADALGTVVTFTVDRLAYSPSPPVIFAVVDFDGGGRLPLELTDATPDDVAVGTRVAMTFRRLHAADGIANYFWKGRPLT
jgi:hydroxymethylglutaryl-CoA synthase